MEFERRGTLEELPKRLKVWLFSLEQ
jgi:hypothetical protein